MNFKSVNLIFNNNKRFNKISLLLAFIIIPDLILFVNPIIKNNYFFILTNPISLVRKNEIVYLKRNLFGTINNNMVPIVMQKKAVLINQLINKDKDGNWDELLVEVDMPANSKDTIEVSFTTNITNIVKTPEFTSIRLSLKSKNEQPTAEIGIETRTRGFKQDIANPYYQMEGPGFENDKVAFRAFFDYRNGKDVYGKIVDTPILKQVGVGASWHTLQPWGMDVFKVGNSVGAGGLAVKEGTQLYRLGDADTSTFTKLYQGLLQAAFKLQFTNWDVGAGHQNGSENISITKGNFFYKNEIKVPLKPTQNLVVGIANFSVDKVDYTKHNSTFSSISTYGNQAEGTGTKLGVAVLFATNAYVENKTSTATDSIPNTSYVVLKAVNNKPNVIYFIACWEKTDKRFSTKKGFDDYVKETAEKLTNPIQVKII